MIVTPMVQSSIRSYRKHRTHTYKGPTPEPTCRYARPAQAINPLTPLPLDITSLGKREQRVIGGITELSQMTG